MANPAVTDTPTKSATEETGAESPTTARPLEMDDDDQETGVIGEDGTTTTSTAPTTPSKPSKTNTIETTPAAETTTSTTTATEAAAPEESETAPPKPPRPVSEAQKNEQTLQEAFPTVDQGVIRAVLSASGGHVEPAFNALLEMTDPDAVKNEPQEQAPAQPPRPQGRTPMSQMEADEIYARQLAEHYDNVGAYEARTSSLGNRSRRAPQGQQQYNEGDREPNFIDDELPVIRENLRQGFLDTQKTVNGWISNLKKRIEENFDESEESAQRQGQPFRRSEEASRRSGDYERYDADPQVLSDDFAGMRFSGDGTPANHPLSGVHRPPPPSKSPRPNDGRRVGFKEGHEEINMYDSSPKVPPKDTPPTSTTKASKWQPLSSVEPEPITDNDPFSLGDSEDEKETKDKPTDAKDDESERLKKAAAEAMADSLVDSKKDGETTKKD